MKNQETTFSPSELQVFALTLALLCLFSPLFPQISHPAFEFVFRSLICLMIALIVYRAGWSYIFESLKSQPLILPLSLTLLLALAGTFNSPDPYRAKSKLALLFTVFFLFSFVTVLPFSSKNRKVIWWGIIIGALLATIQALYKQWTGHVDTIETLKNTPIYEGTMQREIIRSLEANRALGQFGNPNHLAGFLVLSLWPLWLLWQKVNKRSIRTVLIPVALALLFCVYRTYSRSGLLVLIATLFLFFLFEYLERGKKIPWKWIAVSFGLLIVFLSMFILFSNANVFGGRFLTSSTIKARLHFYNGGLNIIQNYPWFGTGTESFESYYCTYLSPGDYESRYVHDVVLEYALEWGILGIFALFWLITTVIIYLKKQWYTNKANKEILYASFGAGFVLFTLSLVDFHNNLMGMLIIPAILLGHTGKPCSYYNEPPHPYKKPYPYLISIFFTLIWLVLIAGNFLNSVYKENGYYLLVDNQPEAAAQAYEKAVMFDRTDAGSWNNLGRIYLNKPSIAAKMLSLSYFKKSIEWAPRRAFLYSDYAEALFTLGYSDKAIEAVKKAQELFPAKPKYYEQLAKYYKLLGMTDKAENERKKAQQLKEQIEAEENDIAFADRTFIHNPSAQTNKKSICAGCPNRRGRPNFCSNHA